MAGIEEAVCIQLAKFNDTEKSVSNARWSNHNKQPVTINQGDSISITKSFIDTRNLSGSGITILEDTPLELEMFFYWINDGNPGNLANAFTNYNSIWFVPLPASSGSDPNADIANFTAPEYTVQMTLQSYKNILFNTDVTQEIPAANNVYVNSVTNSAQTIPYADGRPYLLQYTDNSPFTQTWKYTLKAGTYQPDALASLLTTNMAEVRKDTAAALNKSNAVDWFDPYAPKIKLPNDTTLDQPFQVNTNGSPPVWSIGATSNSKEYNLFGLGIINCQPYIQIQQNNGLPSNWYQGSTGTLNTNSNPIPQPPVVFKPGPPPKPSLCFKNIISDCPITNANINLPGLPGSPPIPAYEMVVGLLYQIQILGFYTNWLSYGDLNVPPQVGDQFVCTNNPSGGKPPSNPNPPINFLQIQATPSELYNILTAGYPWTGPNGFDTNWQLYGRDGKTIPDLFYSNNIQPEPIAITNSTDITLINLNITYTITASTNIDWTQFGATTNVGNTIPYTGMTPNDDYEIVSLGLAYAPGGVTYDTAWAQLGDTNPTLAVGNIFTNTKQYNIPIPSNSLTNIVDGITFTITATSDLINWGALGWAGDPNINNTNAVIPVIDPILLVGFTYKIVSLGVYYGIIDGISYYDTNWQQLTEATTPFPPGYTTPVVGDRFTTDGAVISSQTNISSGAVLNIVPIGQTLLVNFAGDINWSLYGTVPNNNTIPYTDMNTGGQYQIVSLGLPYAPGGVTYDTDWKTLGDTNTTLAVGDVFTCAENYNIPIPNTNLLVNIIDGITFTITATTDNIFWGALGWSSDPNLTQPNPVIPITDPSIQSGKAYLITNTGVPLGIYQDAEIGPITMYDTCWWNFVEVKNPSVSDIEDGDVVIMQLGTNQQFGQSIISGQLLNMLPFDGSLNINVVDVGDIDWSKYGNVPSGGVPFILNITSNPQNAGHDDSTFEAYCIPTGRVTEMISYQSFLPFTFTCNNTGVDFPSYNYTYSGVVIGTGTVKSNGYNVPFEIGITSNPGNADPNDTSFQAITYPTGTVQLINSYQNLIPFTFKATATGVDNPNEFYTYAGEVIGSGTVKSIAPTFPFTFKCTEIPAVLPVDVTYTGTLLPTGTVNLGNPYGQVFECGLDPNNPNFYIYPLKATPVQSMFMNAEYDSSIIMNYTFPMVGASEIELGFNDAGNIFQWNYTHSPIQIATAPTTAGGPVSFTEQVGIVNSFIPDPNITTELPPNKGFVSSTAKLVANSGILFRRMEPASFWQGILGFSKDLIVTDKELGLTNDGTLNPIALPRDLNRFTYERFNNVTTRSLLSTAMNFTTTSTFPNIEPSYVTNMYYPNPATAPARLAYSSIIDSWYSVEMFYNFLVNVMNPSETGGVTNIGTPSQWNETWYEALDQTVTIPAVSTPALISDTYGHYLIEIEGYSSSLLNEQQKYGVKAIVSSYYNNIGSFTSLPFNDEAFLYQHVGESITLNNFRVRILNGKMEEVAGLGENSCVYLQINKAISQVEVQQV